MTPPISLQACPPHIREHPLPGDRCTAPNETFHPPETRFRRLSVVLEAPAFSVRSGAPADADFRYRTGIQGIFRAHRFFNLGIGFDTDYQSELTLTGRVGTTIPLHGYGMYRLGVSAVAGLRQLFGQSHGLGGAGTPVSGPLFAAGGEVAMEFQLLREFSLLPYFRFLASPESEVELASGGRGALPFSWEMQFGLGLSFDFLPDGD